MSGPTDQPEPGLFDIEEWRERAIAEAIAEANATPASDWVPWADVKRWLESWGKPDELPPPPWR